jgi:hypothetical protein
MDLKFIYFLGLSYVVWTKLLVYSNGIEFDVEKKFM